MDYCRLCARNDKKPLIPILTDNPLNINGKLIKLLRIKVNPVTKLPTSICLECLTKLNHFNEFFTTSTENQALLEIIFGEKSEVVEEPEKPRTVLNTTSQDEQLFIIEEIEADESSQDVTEEPEEPPKPPPTPKKRKFDRFDCYLCQDQLTGNLKFLQHFNESHPSDELKYTCFICKAFVKKYRSYTRHIEAHSDKKFSCDICDRSFSQKITLAQHLNSHSSVKSYKCPDCGVNFKQNSSLFKHRKQKHSETTPNCEICHKSFVNNETLQQHMRSKHKAEKNISCPDCGKLFASRSALIYHKSSQHKNDKSNSFCEVCKKQFKTAVILTRHIKNVH